MEIFAFRQFFYLKTQTNNLTSAASLPFDRSKDSLGNVRKVEPEKAHGDKPLEPQARGRCQGQMDELKANEGFLCAIYPFLDNVMLLILMMMI
jgi:hypothetical protein